MSDVTYAPWMQADAKVQEDGQKWSVRRLLLFCAVISGTFWFTLITAAMKLLG